MKTIRTIGDVASLVRSKNAGPFWMTIDVFFATDADYQRAAAPGVLTEDVIAGLYRVAAANVALYRLPNIRVIKASFPRPVVQGSFADREHALRSAAYSAGEIPYPMTEDD